MTRIYFPSTGPEDWRRLLADPVKHWCEGYSAMTLAACWEHADGLPPEISQILADLGPAPELLMALPEHKVPLPGANRGDSQSDVFALVRAGTRTIACAVEGKVDEPFDKPLSDWLINASNGKRQRLAYICDLLNLAQPLPDELHYQLLHRTAAAVIEAKRFKTDAACMIVHSFSRTGKWFDEFERFAAVFGKQANQGKLLTVRPDSDPPLYIGWAAGDQRFLTKEIKGTALPREAH